VKGTMGRVEDNVVSLEVAKELQKAGVNSSNLFNWRVWSDTSVDCAMVDEDDFDYSGAGRRVTEKIPAYTATELMKELPSLVRTSKGNHFMLCVYKERNSYIVEYEGWRCDEIETLCEFENRKLADVLAQALIWYKTERRKNI